MAFGFQKLDEELEVPALVSLEFLLSLLLLICQD